MAVFYLTVVMLGVMHMPLQMFGPALCEVKGAEGKIALTFDDGPDPETTPQVLDVLRKAGARATFFVIGRKVDLYPEVTRRIHEEGHVLAVHSYAHHRLYAFLSPRQVKEDIERTRDAIERVTGVRPLWFRPPVGQMSPRTAEGIRRANAEAVGFSVRAFDGLRGARADKCLHRVRKGLKSGAIVLLHDAPERKAAFAAPPLSEGSGERVALPEGGALLPEILRELRERGLSAVTLPELVLAGRD